MTMLFALITGRSVRNTLSVVARFVGAVVVLVSALVVGAAGSHRVSAFVVDGCETIVEGEGGCNSEGCNYDYCIDFALPSPASTDLHVLADISPSSDQAETLGRRYARAHSDVGFLAPNTIHPSDIRLSQATVNGPKTSTYADSMRRNGWQGESVDVVRMQDGGLTTFDNKRVVAANDAGINVRANIHDFDAPFPADRLGPKSPGTWGEAITDRIGNQKPGWRNCYPMGAPFTCRMGE